MACHAKQESIMKKTAIALTVAGLLSAGSVLASSPEWVSGWGMGITEYSVNDGRGNELYISCPDDEYEHVKAYATVNGNTKNSEDQPGFTVIVDGEVYDNPFFTDCRVCAANFEHFWGAFIKARELQIKVDGKTADLPTKNISKVVLPLNHPENSCTSAW